MGTGFFFVLIQLGCAPLDMDITQCCSANILPLRLALSRYCSKAFRSSSYFLPLNLVHLSPTLWTTRKRISKGEEVVRV